jgi:hypothetical protein
MNVGFVYSGMVAMSSVIIWSIWLPSSTDLARSVSELASAKSWSTFLLL